MEIILGLLLGVTIGATGVGGGTLVAPALILFLGYAPRSAVATALIYSAAVKLLVSAVYLIKHQVDFRVLTYLLVGGVPGAVIGAMALQRLANLKADQWVVCGVGAIVTISALFKLICPPAILQKNQDRHQLLSLGAFPIGLEVGFSSAGSGALGSLLIFHLTSLSAPTVVGTDLVFGMVVSIVGGGIHSLSGNCDWSTLGRMIPAGILGTLAGVHISSKLAPGALRKAVLVCVASVGIMLLTKGFQ